MKWWSMALEEPKEDYGEPVLTEEDRQAALESLQRSQDNIKQLTELPRAMEEYRARANTALEAFTVGKPAFRIFRSADGFYNVKRFAPRDCSVVAQAWDDVINYGCNGYEPKFEEWDNGVPVFEDGWRMLGKPHPTFEQAERALHLYVDPDHESVGYFFPPLVRQT